MNDARRVHPLDALLASGEQARRLPVCDHYAGTLPLMQKSLALQAQLGPVFDLTLDCEDGAPVGREGEHAHLVADVLTSPENLHGRVGVRVHAVDHPSFAHDVDTIVGRGGDRLAYLMVPKARHLADVERACAHIDHQVRVKSPGRYFPVHALIETHGALRDVWAIAAHPRIESLSFGLMDFVSSHGGAIPSSAMSAEGQFTHPLVLRAKLEIAAACHAAAKTPSHCVVTEFNDTRAVATAAGRAWRELGYTRMWSIHPKQILPIVEAFAPSAAEVDQAIAIVSAAQNADWAPIRHRDVLHDRASYRYFWQVLERAHRTGQPLPAEVEQHYFSEAASP